MTTIIKNKKLDLDYINTKEFKNKLKAFNEMLDKRRDEFKKELKK
jgi:hypothetical protein